MQPNDENDAIEKEKEGRRIRSKLNYWLYSCLVYKLVVLGVELDQSDLKRVADLWNNVINPACLQFEKETGKPAEAMREAIAGGFERRVKTFHRWNAWQRIWWNKMPNIGDKAIISASLSCCNCPPLTGCITQSDSTRAATVNIQRRLQS
jgi:hypothetical protein